MSDNKPMPMNKALPIFIVIALAVGGASFYGGMVYGWNQAATNLSAQRRGGFDQQFGGGQFRGGNGANRTGGPGEAGGRNGAGFVNGEIIAADARSITVKMRDGGSKIILFSDKTEISKFVAGAAGDLQVGENVMVTGTPNSDGSVTAQTIQQRPAPPAEQSQPPAQPPTAN